MKRGDFIECPIQIPSDIALVSGSISSGDADIDNSAAASHINMASAPVPNTVLSFMFYCQKSQPPPVKSFATVILVAFAAIPSVQMPALQRGAFQTLTQELTAVKSCTS